MKTIDFTKPGGFPLTQDQLGYLQLGYSECFNALAQVGGSGPIVINGCIVTRSLVSGTIYNYAITGGWVYYLGSMIRVPGSTLSAVNESANAVYLLLTPSSAPLTYNDGSTPGVINDITGSLVAQPTGTANDATHFALSSLQPYGREPAEGHIVVNTAAGVGGVSGDIYYRKNFLNNTLQIRGLMGAVNAQNFATASTMASYLLGYLPSGYFPKNPAYLVGEIILLTGSRIKDDLGIAWLDKVTIEIDSSAGGIYAFFKKPEVSIVSYPIVFNCIVPLD
jgi:hypothetical protein